MEECSTGTTANAQRVRSFYFIVIYDRYQQCLPPTDLNSLWEYYDSTFDEWEEDYWMEVTCLGGGGGNTDEPNYDQV